MIVKTVFSGFGGQGVLMMGYTFALAAMNQGFEVTYLPAYGAEVRGGTANCTVAVADEEIASPIASEPDYVVVLNTPSLYTFQNRIASGGLLFLNSSIISARSSRADIEVIEIPAGEIADSLGNSKASNTVMMGGFLKRIGLIKSEVYLKSLEEIMGSKKKALVELNRNAFTAGYSSIK